MTLQGRLRRLTALTIAALAAACALAPSAAGMASRPADGDLSSRLAKLAKPSVRDAPRAKQAAILDVAPSGPGSLLRDGNRVLVDVRFDHGAAAGADDLRAAGAEIVHVSRRYQTATISVLPDLLYEVAGVPRVDAVTENLTPITYAAPGPVASVVTPCFGAATSEGDTQLNAMMARDAFNVDGTGVTVGILSDSFDRDPSAMTSADEDVLSGDLPGSNNPCGQTTPVDERGDTYAGDDASDEGRAMAQIVHDLAPGAELTFATAFISDIVFAANIRALADAGAKVIVDDVAYFDEPFFQDGPIAVAVNDVTTQDGVTYFSSAGNNNLFDRAGNDIASWEAPSFRDAGSCPAALTAALGPEQCMDFDPGAGTDTTFEITVSNEATLTVDLQWQEPWDGVVTDLDAFLLDSKDDPLQVDGFFVGSADDNIGDSQQPLEVFQWKNTSGSSQRVRLAIDRCFGTCNPAANPLTIPRLKFALLQNGGGVTLTEYTAANSTDIFGPTIFGHNGAESAMSVGAIRFSTRSAPEAFSSRGPVTHYFGPVSGTTPAAPLGSPKVLTKPDLVATNGGANTFFGSCVSNVWRFFGTSASAPHAAAIAALELEAVPGTPPADVKRAQIDTAAEVAGFPATTVGAGIVDAYGAIDSLVGGSPTGSQATQSTAQNCNLLPPSPPAPPPPAPLASPQGSAASDSVSPQTFIARGPAKISFTPRQGRLVTFRFRSSEGGSDFLCKIDRLRFRPCDLKLVRWFGVGKHVLRVKARDAAGNVDPTPAVYRFRVKRIR